MHPSQLLLLLFCLQLVDCSSRTPSPPHPSKHPNSRKIHSPQLYLEHRQNLKISKPEYTRSPKSAVPDTNCIPTDGMTTYTGLTNTTASGRTCQLWSIDTPHITGYSYRLSKFPDLQENYCRNPDGDAEMWCYTTDPTTRWEVCDISVCNSYTKGNAYLTGPGCYIIF